MAEAQRKKKAAADDEGEAPERKGPEVPEGAEFMGDGTLRVHIANERYTLRRPRVGEYKRLREYRYEVEDEKLQNLRGALLPGEPEPAEGTDELRAQRLERTLATRRAGREAAVANEKLEAAWVRTVFEGDPERRLEGLCSRALPDDEDEWPLWLAQPDFATQLFNHWRSVPLARGAR